MRGPVKSALPLTIITLAGSLLTLSPVSIPAQAEPACQTSPKPAAPAGSHWYFRTDRATQRKCWYLSSKDGDKDAPQQTTSAALRTQPATKQKAAADDTTSNEIPPEANDTPKSVKTTVVDAMPQAPVAPPPAATQPAPTQPAVTQQVAQSDVSERQQVATDTSTQLQPPAEPQPLPTAESTPAQQPIIVSTAPPAPPPEPRTPLLQYVFLAIAVFGLVGGSVLYIAELRRRRDDVLNVAVRRDTFKPADPVDQLTPPPPPPRAADPEHEDLAELLKRLSQQRAQRPRPVRERAADHQDLSSIGSTMRA